MFGISDLARKKEAGRIPSEPPAGAIKLGIQPDGIVTT